MDLIEQTPSDSGRFMDYLRRHKLALIILVGAAVRLWLVLTAQGLNSDGFKFARVAEHMARYGVAEGMKGYFVWPYYPVNARLVVYPFLGGLLYRLVGDPVLALRLVSALFGTLLIPLTYLVARDVSKSAAVALLAAALVALEPEFARGSAAVYRETTAAFFALLAFYLLLRTLRLEGGWWPAAAALTGAVLFVGFLTRVEFALLAAALCAVCLLVSKLDWQKRLLVPAIICAVFCLLELPYFMWLRHQTGRNLFSQWQVHRHYKEKQAVDRFIDFQERQR